LQPSPQPFELGLLYACAGAAGQRDREFESGSLLLRVKHEPCGWRGLIKEAVRPNEVLFQTLATGAVREGRIGLSWS
jgi:hypothetical protein